jgi:transposase
LAGVTLQDHELYQQIPGWESPWSVSKVALDVLQQQVDVFVEHPSGTNFCCPE